MFAMLLASGNALLTLPDLGEIHWQLKAVCFRLGSDAAIMEVRWALAIFKQISIFLAPKNSFARQKISKGPYFRNRGPKEEGVGVPTGRLNRRDGVLKK